MLLPKIVVCPLISLFRPFHIPRIATFPEPRNEQRQLSVPGLLALNEWSLLLDGLQEKLATHSHSCRGAQIDMA